MREITYSQAIKEAMCERMRKDPDVFIMGEDIGVYGGNFNVTTGMIDEFGCERVRSTPISEAVLAGAATGAALTGMRPIAEIMLNDFSAIAMDQIVNHAAKLRYMSGGQVNVPVVFRVPEGAGAGAAAQHSQSLEAWYCHVPGLKVVAPSTPYDAKGLLSSAICDDNPVMFFESKILYKTIGEIPDEEYFVPIGKADCKRIGNDLSIITYGSMLPRVLSAAETLSNSGIEAEVIDLRTLSPLDTRAIIDTATKTGRVLIVHEACTYGGFGGEIAATLAGSEAFSYLKKPIKRLCGKDIPIPFTHTLESLAVPSEDDIVNAALELHEG